MFKCLSDILVLLPGNHLTVFIRILFVCVKLNQSLCFSERCRHGTLILKSSDRKWCWGRSGASWMLMRSSWSFRSEKRLKISENQKINRTKGQKLFLFFLFGSARFCSAVSGCWSAVYHHYITDMFPDRLDSRCALICADSVCLWLSNCVLLNIIY